MGTIEVIELSSSESDDDQDFDANDPENINSQRKIWEKHEQQKKDEEFARKLQEEFQSDLESTQKPNRSSSIRRCRSSVEVDDHDGQQQKSEETKKTEEAVAGNGNKQTAENGSNQTAKTDPEIRIGVEEESDTEVMEVEIESPENLDESLEESVDDDDDKYSEILDKKCVVRISEAERAKADYVTRIFRKINKPLPDYSANISLPKLEKVPPKRPRCDEINCHVCKKTLENQAAFKTHFLECHQGLNLEEGTVFPTQPKRRHWEQKPIKTKTHRCTTCGAELFDSQIESHINEYLDEYHNVEHMDMINEESQPKQKVQRKYGRF